MHSNMQLDPLHYWELDTPLSLSLSLSSLPSSLPPYIAALKDPVFRGQLLNLGSGLIYQLNYRCITVLWSCRYSIID